jgi:dTDP-4-dehydrorhamnose 3,5-epimerase-like enzyme
VIGFANTSESTVAKAEASVSTSHIIESKVNGVRAHHLPFISDPRGNLTVGEFERTLPFIPKRYFITFDVPNAKLRGEHAHKKCEQFLVCVRGSCAVVVDDGTHREEFLLDRPTFGVHVPAMIWATEYKHSPDSTLMVFTSDYYDPDDYIRDYQEFLTAKKSS